MGSGKSPYTSILAQLRTPCEGVGRKEEKQHALYNLTILWGSPGPLASTAPLFPRKLLIQLGHVVVPLRLVTCACHRGSQVILLAEGRHLELAAMIS